MKEIIRVPETIDVIGTIGIDEIGEPEISPEITEMQAGTDNPGEEGKIVEKEDGETTAGIAGRTDLIVETE